MRFIPAIIVCLFGCTASDQHPIYQQLKANPPTSVPSEALPRLRRGLGTCLLETSSGGEEYVICWSGSRSGAEPPSAIARFIQPGPHIRRNMRRNGGRFIPTESGGGAIVRLPLNWSN